jgi:hypothetical protein
MWSHCRR